MLPEGITIVPLLHDAIADVIAGTSSMEEDPPATGVQVEARALRMGDAFGRARVRGMAKRSKRVVVLGAMMVDSII